MVRTGAMSKRDQHDCHHCQTSFESRNKLFAHMREAHSLAAAKPVDLEEEARRKAAKLKAKWAKRNAAAAAATATTTMPDTAPPQVSGPAAAPQSAENIKEATSQPPVGGGSSEQCQLNPLCRQRGRWHKGECILCAPGEVSRKSLKKASKTASACNQRIVFEPLVQEAQSVRAPTGGSQDQITTNVDDATSQGTKRKERDRKSVV